MQLGLYKRFSTSATNCLLCKHLDAYAEMQKRNWNSSWRYMFSADVKRSTKICRRTMERTLGIASFCFYLQKRFNFVINCLIWCEKKLRVFLSERHMTKKASGKKNAAIFVTGSVAWLCPIGNIAYNPTSP